MKKVFLGLVLALLASTLRAAGISSTYAEYITFPTLYPYELYIVGDGDVLPLSVYSGFLRTLPFQRVVIESEGGFAVNQNTNSVSQVKTDCYLLVAVDWRGRVWYSDNDLNPGNKDIFVIRDGLTMNEPWIMTAFEPPGDKEIGLQIAINAEFIGECSYGVAADPSIKDPA